MSISASALAAASPGFAQQIESPAWDLLGEIAIEEVVTDTSYEVRKIFPSDIIVGVTQFDTTGYVVPLGDVTNVKAFLLVSDMGFCPFCGDPAHGTALQVTLATALPMLEEGTRLSLRGSLEPVKDNQTWQSAIMRGAVVVDG